MPIGSKWRASTRRSEKSAAHTVIRARAALTKPPHISALERRQRQAGSLPLPSACLARSGRQTSNRSEVMRPIEPPDYPPLSCDAHASRPPPPLSRASHPRPTEWALAFFSSPPSLFFLFSQGCCIGDYIGRQRVLFGCIARLRLLFGCPLLGSTSFSSVPGEI